MGVKFDRILDGFDGPFVKLTDFAKVPAGTIAAAQTPAGYYFSHRSNDSFIAINRLLAAGEEVSWLADGPMGPGTFYVAAKPTTRAILQKAATDLGVSFEPRRDGAGWRRRRSCASRASGCSTRTARDMPSGWTRLMLENFEFPYERRLPARSRQGRPAREVRRDRLQRRRPARRRWRRRGGGRGPAGGDAPAPGEAARARLVAAAGRPPGVAVAAGAPASRRSRFPRSSRAGRAR